MKRLTSLLLLGALSACKSHSGDAAPKPAPSASAVPEVRVAPKPVALTSIPTEEDFEEEAEQQITGQNVEGELDKLEQELKAP